MEFNKVKKALDRLDGLQQEQIKTFDTDLLPDLESQMTQRKQGFANLENAMADLMSPAKTDIADASAVKEIVAQIQVLMHQNKALSSRIQHHRDELKKSMNGVKKGRKVVLAYGSPIFHSNPPKVINSKN